MHASPHLGCTRTSTHHPTTTSAAPPFPCPPTAPFAAAALRMESALFVKLCKECYLVNDRLTVAQVDLAFGRAADKVGGKTMYS